MAKTKPPKRWDARAALPERNLCRRSGAKRSRARRRLSVGGTISPLLAIVILGTTPTRGCSDDFSKTRQLLKNSYDILHPRLTALGIRIVSPCGAGIFCFADFRSLLSEQSFAGERILFNKMADTGVVLTPGESCHCAIPGFFRICFAWVPVSSLLEAIRRIEVMATSLSESKSQLKDN